MPKPCRLLLCLFSFSRKYCCSSAKSSVVRSLPVKNRGLSSECNSAMLLSSWVCRATLRCARLFGLYLQSDLQRIQIADFVDRITQDFFINASLSSDLTSTAINGFLNYMAIVPTGP